jgi:hypothetical protein
VAGGQRTNHLGNFVLVDRIASPTFVRTRRAAVKTLFDMSGRDFAAARATAMTLIWAAIIVSAAPAPHPQASK